MLTLRRLRARTEQTGSHWLWTGAFHAGGYGAVRFQGRVRGAHQAAYELRHGPIGKGLLVLHRCDRPACVNPSHLSAGTARQNVQDALSRARWAGRGIRSKLTRQSAQAIRTGFLRRGAKHLPALARRHGISQSHARQVAQGRYWRRRRR